MWCIARSTCSQVQEEELSLASCSDIELLGQSKSNHIPEKFCLPGSLTEAYLNSLSGTMLKPFHSKMKLHEAMLNGSEKGARNSSYVAGSRSDHARILASLESKLVLAKKREADCIGKSSESLTWLDRGNYSWKTCQQSFLTDWELFSQIFPRGGILHDGFVYELPMLAQIMEGIGGGCSQERWATPNTMDSLPPKSPEALHREATIVRPGRSKPSNLRDQVSNQKMWPTPQASDNRDRGNMSDKSIQRRIAIGKQIGLSTVVKESKGGGSLNPTWTEWLMGWPLEWTGLKP